jgi:ABC-type cobalamin/Fe3+-siderophores transport system ATPase subunit
LVGSGPPEAVLTPELIHSVFRVQARVAQALTLELPS